jgi:hypothetical protein
VPLWGKSDQHYVLRFSSGSGDIFDTLDEVKHFLESKEYPANMQTFKSQLASVETVGGVAQRVFSQYDYDGAYADVLLTTIQSVHIGLRSHFASCQFSVHSQSDVVPVSHSASHQIGQFDTQQIRLSLR